MPWMEMDTMSLRLEFVTLALHDASNVRELCRRFKISRKTGYKWINRFLRDGPEGMSDRSRRPQSSPIQTSEEMEQKVLEVRKNHPAWGGRKIRARLLMNGEHGVPSASTITQILRRYDKLDPDESKKHEAWIRFEYEAPNQLWQMDYKGHFAMGRGRCHPLTILDDHSRYSIGLFACKNEQEGTVKTNLIQVFRKYGLPDRFLVDNGPPWGSDQAHQHTRLSAWLMHIGVGVIHGRPYHPETQGKDERFHRTLKAEVLRYQFFEDLAQCQVSFDQWRQVYNYERPHEAVDMNVPASRYRPSKRSFPETLPPIEYGPGDEVRKIGDHGRISYQGKEYWISKAFRGYPVGLRPTLKDGLVDVYFLNHKIGNINLRDDGH